MCTENSGNDLFCVVYIVLLVCVCFRLRVGFTSGPQPLIQRIVYHMMVSSLHTASMSQVSYRILIYFLPQSQCCPPSTQPPCHRSVTVFSSTYCHRSVTIFSSTSCPSHNAVLPPHSLHVTGQLPYSHLLLATGQLPYSHLLLATGQLPYSHLLLATGQIPYSHLLLTPVTMLSSLHTASMSQVSYHILIPSHNGVITFSSTSCSNHKPLICTMKNGIDGTLSDNGSIIWELMAPLHSLGSSITNFMVDVNAQQHLNQLSTCFQHSGDTSLLK